MAVFTELRVALADLPDLPVGDFFADFLLADLFAFGVDRFAMLALLRLAVFLVTHFLARTGRAATGGARNGSDTGPSASGMSCAARSSIFGGSSAFMASAA
ncbi:MAG: hypothetical protein KGK16_14470 [Bradyrhizobium sp.]|nr:hypothetical protein [Bradyrhizobium sp.]MDE2331975.1 hypothetical protein [Bradyrhizobium sp.]